MDVGFIGLGNMGQEMARNLIKAGNRVRAYNRTRSRADALLAEGAMLAERPADTCDSAVVISMLADDAAVENVVFGDGGVIGALPRNAVHVSMSTITVALSERLEAAHRGAGQRYVAAPVFGRPDAAAAAKLFIVAAGEPAALQQCRELFDAIGQRTFTVGDHPASANLIKLSGNFLIAATIECLGETVALMRKSGVDPRVFIEVITNTLFSAPVYKTYGGLIVEEKFEPAGFKMPLGLKDVRSVLLAAEAKSVPMPVASVVRDHFLAGIARGGADLDWSALSRVLAENAGL